MPELSQIARSLPIVDSRRNQYPEMFVDLANGVYRDLGEQYIERTRKYRSDRSFFTDKTLGNFMHIGLLELILPNAKIINARRHPLDTCLGCYKQLFARGQSFSYDLEELGEYYLQYQRLMDHWDALLPGKVLHIHYEDVTADLESQVLRILEHCGLPWDEGCLRFFENKRDVRTASSEQVRQPIYRSSVNLWQHYEPHLAELIDVLQPLLLQLSKQDQPEVLCNNSVT